jgi:outer membrane protein assembly factor BamB
VPYRSCRKKLDTRGTVASGARGAVDAWVLAAAILAVSSTASWAEDWPTHRHDNQRSGITGEALELPLKPAWTFIPMHPPHPAWPPPAARDVAHKGPVYPRVTFDRAFHTAAVGDAVYFGSSTDDHVYCLDAATGAIRWSFIAGGPVRFAPAVHEGRVYVASDDGAVYCLDAGDGAVVWTYTAAEAPLYLPGNGRMVSNWPVRTGLVVEDGLVCFAAGLFPMEGVHLCALDPRTGTPKWVTQPDRLSPQGYLLASPDRLYVPTGRTSPAMFARAAGAPLGMLDTPGGEGGAFALLTPDVLVSGPGTRLRAFDARTGDVVVSFPGRHIIITDGIAYLVSEEAGESRPGTPEVSCRLSAIDRGRHRVLTEQRVAIEAHRKEAVQQIRRLKSRRRAAEGEARDELERQVRDVAAQVATLAEEFKGLEGREQVWTVPTSPCHALILADTTLFAGGDDTVAAYRTEDGREVWSAQVEGRALGLAVANERLLVSTDSGAIHCFVRRPGKKHKVMRPEPRDYPNGASAVKYETVAKQVLDETGIRRGYCLVLGCGGEGRLLYELAKRSDLRVIGIDSDADRVEAARRRLSSAGCYGERTAVIAAPLAELPFNNCVADLVVVDPLVFGETPPCTEAEIERILSPYGGTAYVAPETLVRRGTPKGAGEWTHEYADPGNTACSRDELVGGPMRVQWYGRPGPREIIDRHHRPHVPLSRDGRLFVPGDASIFAVDAYNGFPLWQASVPDSRRVGSQRDAGNMAVAEDCLYFASGDACLGFDAASGERILDFKLPNVGGDAPRQWGYVATVDDLLLGSGIKAEAPYIHVSTLGDYEIQWGDFKRMVTSDFLFCMDRHTGELKWSYRNGVVVNPAIAMGGGRLFFIESRNPGALADEDGKIALEVLLDRDAHLVALDVATGAVAWERPVDLSILQHIVFLSFADGVLLVTGSRNHENAPWYSLHAFKASDGTPLWQQSHSNNSSGVGGDHGEQIHHPVIIGHTVVAEPVAYDLFTGDRVNPEGGSGEWVLPGRRGCGTLSASASCLFYRDSNPAIYTFKALSGDASGAGSRLLDNGEAPLNLVNRTGCWINMIPAGGLVLIPEGSSGCICSYPLQTSMAFAPRSQ